MTQKTLPPRGGPLLGRCYSCVDGLTDDYKPCPECNGSGICPVTRDDAWTRRKEYVGTGHSNKDGWEKWTRFSADIPPELAEALEAAYRRRIRRYNHDAFTRADIARSALRLLLNEMEPETRATDSTAEDIPDRDELPSGASARRS